MKRIIVLSCLLIFIIAYFAENVCAKDPLQPLKIAEAPEIDGLLDDAVWQNAPSQTEFTTWYPDFGKPLSQDTRVWYAYDRENIYFAFRCYDSEPDKIKSSVSARDKIRSDDWICLNIDTFNDQQSLYAFYVNPQGIQEDSRAIGANEDISMDFVWYSRGRIDEQGYTVEVRIPLKSIRYTKDEPVTMGIIFERRISRTSEQATYPPLDPDQGANFNTQMQPIIYNGLKKYSLVEILPAVTWGNIRSWEEEGWKTTRRTEDVSLTAKYGITPSLIFDATVNPDFSQIEADAGQVDFNQRFALFYPEKRPFFLEGRENFNFGGSKQGDPLYSMVHTRTIGDPRLGIKFTGKIGEKNTIASIYALDKLPDNHPWGNDVNVAILRYKRSLRRDGYLGGFFTTRESDPYYNRVGGIDSNIRLTPSSSLGFHTFLSWSRDENTRKTKKGNASGLSYDYQTRNWEVSLHGVNLSPEFRNECGYITRTGIFSMQSSLIHHLYPQRGMIKRFDPRFSSTFAHDKQSDLWEWDQSLSFVFLLPRSTLIFLGYTLASEIYLKQQFGRSRIKFRFWSQIVKQFYFNLRYDYGEKIRYSINPFQGRGNDGSVSMIYQPSDQFQSTFSVQYSDLYRNRSGERIFDYTIVRSKNIYQLNRYLFFRVIAEYNDFYEELLTDILVSFTYIPGTVIHAGYGSIYNRMQWKNGDQVHTERFYEKQRGLFFKASYLLRL
ncbi:MAG: DUF5916 domain-containing protein [bacterium]